MKKIFFLLPVFFLLIISCNNDKGNKPNDKNKNGNETNKNSDEEKFSIVGTWHIDDMERDNGEKPTEEEMKEIRSSTIEFTSSGTYIASKTGDSDKESGTYTFDSKILETIKDGKDKKEILNVVSISKNKMVFHSDDEKITLVRN